MSHSIIDKGTFDTSRVSVADERHLHPVDSIVFGGVTLPF